MDTYHFYKYLAIPVFDMFIEEFSINKLDGKLLKNFFYKFVEDNNENFIREHTFKLKSNFHGKMYCYFFILSEELIELLVSKSVTIIQRKIGLRETLAYGYSNKVNIDLYKPIEEFLSTDECNDLKNELVDFEKEVLKKRHDMLEFVDKKDPDKHKKYLKRKSG